MGVSDSGAVTEFDETALVDALGRAQALGMLGDRPIPEAIEHSRTVVRALDGVTGTVADLGAGGGLPGLVIVRDRPDLCVELIDRRAKRTDFLERLVRRHDLLGRVVVTSADATVLVRACAAGDRPRVDAVVARGFGPPATTIRIMTGLVRRGGRLVVTEPPGGDRWDRSLLAELGLERVDVPDADGVAIFETLVPR